KATALKYAPDKNKILEVIGAPKSMLASFDVSAMGRQGAALGSRFREDWKNAFKSQLQYFGSDDAFKAGMDEIASRPTYDIMRDKMKLALTGISDEVEERFVSELPQKIPLYGKGIKASDRAYT